MEGSGVRAVMRVTAGEHPSRKCLSWGLWERRLDEEGRARVCAGRWEQGVQRDASGLAGIGDVR